VTGAIWCLFVMQTKAHKQLVVYISGNGSNLQAIIDAISKGKINAEIALVVSNKTGAFGLERAKKAGIKTLVKLLKPYKDAGKSRVEYDLDLAREVIELTGQPDLQVLAGFMHILSAEFLQQFTCDMINLHPALPGCFDGARAIERAFKAFKDGTIPHTGVMVHKVIPEVDRGEPVVQQIVPILESDTVKDLEDSIHQVEHNLLIEGIIKVLG
jgi:formyltetrahydrofolate-dependent phosphoribosylglycinamide formyltransferase